MESRDQTKTDASDRTAAVTLEISDEIASRVDELLSEFAEDAGVETVLVVDRSGALVSGVSAEAEVTVEVISALVAGASGAMRALVARLGETGAVESLHLGGNRLIYLREVAGRFILVAVAEASRPAGLVREKAASIEAGLAEILGEIRVSTPPWIEAAPPMRSLREAARVASEPPGGIPSPPPPEVTDEMEEQTEPEVVSEQEEPLVLPCGEEPGFEETFESLDLEPGIQAWDGEVSPVSGEPSPPPPHVVPTPVPREILEPIDFGEPEIVIEGPVLVSRSEVLPGGSPIDSPFETDDADEEEDEEENEETDSRGASIFELEEDEDEGESGQGYGSPSPVEIVSEKEIPETGMPPGTDEETDSGNIFEIDEGEDWEIGGETGVRIPSGAPESVGNGDDLGREIGKMIDEEEEESEIRSSGPFYF